MKKVSIVAIMMLLLLSMVGCSNSTSKKAIEQGNLAMANLEYDKALASFKLAIDEGSKDEEVQIMYNVIESYNKAMENFESGNIEEANKVITIIDGRYQNYAIKKDVDNLKSDIERKIKERDEELKTVAIIENLIKENKYSEAKKEIEGLNIEYLDEDIQSSINKLNETIEVELEKEEEIKKQSIKSENKEQYKNEDSRSDGVDTNKKYVCERCYKVSNEHNFIVGITVCNDCSSILYEENFME